IDTGLKYVNNDACYPSLLVVGQMMSALESGKYDLDKTALIISQTGGGCRATNYIGFIRRALKKAGLEKIPVISLNLSGLEPQPGFKITLPLITRGVYSVFFGDIFQKCVYRMRPYEVNKGETDAIHEKWLKKCIDFLNQKHVSYFKFKKMCKEMVEEFDKIELRDVKKPRVGVVGEILVKFSPTANNHVVELLESEGAEAVVPDLMDFLLYCFKNQEFKAENLGTSKKSAFIANVGIKFVEFMRLGYKKACQKSVHFSAPADIKETAKNASEIVSIGNQTGEGWFLTGEMIELIHENTPNIICAQPFGCLPNHVVGKGVIKQLRKHFPGANIVAIDHDPGASEVNQLNRIKLMLASAHKSIKNAQ
ncbi:MAG: 2-hydroxyacyl-CoA dehydratase, partial [Lachnospiraceae bacterium]|nr:2-hydroxyacyl-CoA dehydratase [Lachnospiraceae bacterium]